MSFDIQTLEFHFQLQKLATFAKNKEVQSSLLALPVLTNEEEITLSWQYIDDILSLKRLYHDLPLTPNYDSFNILKLIEKGHILSLEEAYHMLLSLTDLFFMYQYIKNVENKDQYVLIRDYPIVHFSEVYQAFINVMNEEGNIKDDATPVLKSIRKKLHTIDQRYTRSLQESLSQYGSYLNEHVIVTRGDALCLAVSDSYKNNVKGIVHDISQSKQTVYIEPHSAKAIRDEKIILIEEEKVEILKILKQLSKVLMSHVSALIDQIHTLRMYDTYQAKALFALELKANRPEIDAQQFHLIQARHPSLSNHVVPIQVYLKKRLKGLFISGSNTGGKTVTLKTIGLLHLMAQAGLFIPASDTSKIMIFEHIFADIGDQQSIEHNLSTFSSHLKKHKQMLRHANHKTLLLIDEIGSGTDPQEGVAIAQALLDTYEEKGANFVVTTHYQALKQFAIKKEYLNASVAFDQQSLQPTYHIEYGLSGHSHAFDIASRLGIDHQIIKRAKENYASLQTENEKMLASLEKKENALNLEKKKLELTYETVKTLEHNLSHDIQQFEKYKDVKLQQIIDAKEKEFNKKLETINQLLKDLKDKKEISIAQYAAFKNIQHNTLLVEDSNVQIKYNIGDEVYIASYDQLGVIEKIKNSRYFVRVGSFLLEFGQSSLSKPEKKETKIKKTVVKEKPNVTSFSTKPTAAYHFQLDLRGFRYDDVKPALDKAIDQAILSNQPTMRIIHGYGTGAVKNAVYEIIKHHPEIKSFRYGQEGEGLTGATIIYFK